MEGKLMYRYFLSPIYFQIFRLVDAYFSFTRILVTQILFGSFIHNLLILLLYFIFILVVPPVAANSLDYQGASQKEQLLVNVSPNVPINDMVNHDGLLKILYSHYAGKEQNLWCFLEFGPELRNDHFALRIAGGGQWYTPDNKYGLRLDAGIAQDELRPELSKVLLSGGAKLTEKDQLVFSAGWLQRYAWIDVPKLGEKGDGLSQYLTGLEYRHELRSLGSTLAPGILFLLNGTYCQSNSKKLWGGGTLKRWNRRVSLVLLSMAWGVDLYTSPWQA
jgi:hypothetical protein